MADFTSIPLLDYSTLSVDRAKFIAELRNVATNIGFMTLKNTPVPWALVEKVLSYTPALFNLPFSDKVKVEMATNPHFLGYNRLGYEITKGEMDLREQWDFGPEYPSRWQKRGDPIHHRVHGPGVWPEETQENGLVGFKATTLEYIRKVTDFSYEFLRLIEEAVGLKPGALDVFSDDQTRGGGSIKLVRYPPASPDFTTNQGVGAHKDPYITFLVQGDELPGLQVQNGRGEWIDCPPKPECFVVNFGTILETAT